MAPIIRKFLIISLCGVMLLTQWACEKTTGPLHENVSQKPVTIGVTIGRFIPTLEFKNSNTIQSGSRWSPRIPDGPPTVLLALALLLLVGIGYGMYKIFEGTQNLFMTPNNLQEISKAQEKPQDVVRAYQENETSEVSNPQEILKKALAELRMQEAFGEAFVTQARASTPHTVVMVKEYGPQTKDDLPSDYHEISEKELEKILEIRIESIGLINGGGGENPPFSLAMKVRVRLIRLPGQNNLYNNHFLYRSEPRSFREWADNQAQPFREAITHAYDDLAKRIIHKGVLVEPET